MLAFDEAGRLALEMQVAGTVDGGEVEVASLVIATANDSGMTECHRESRPAPNRRHHPR